MHTKGLAIFVVILVTFHLVNSVINTFKYLILVEQKKHWKNIKRKEELRVPSKFCYWALVAQMCLFWASLL
jgi:hypothetical protein